MSLNLNAVSYYAYYFRESDKENARTILSWIFTFHKFIGMSRLTKQFKVLVEESQTVTQTVNYLERFRIAINQSNGVQIRAKNTFEKYVTRFATAESVLIGCYLGHTELVKKFFVKNAAIPFDLVSNNSNNSLLHYAVNEGHTDLALWLIDSNAPVDIEETELNRTPLHKACLLGRVKIAKALIDAGAKINHPDIRGLTPLHLACSSHPSKKDPTLRARLALHLFAAGADPSIPDNDGDKPSSYFHKKDLKTGFIRYNDARTPAPFPKDMWIYIFKYLPFRDLTSKIMPVSKAFHNLAAETLVTSFLSK